MNGLSAIVLLAVAGSSIWVLVDARNLGIRRGLIDSGFADMGPGSWFVGCLLIWIVVFPLYLAYRPRFVAALSGGQRQEREQAQPYTPVAPPPPPLLSPDGQWVWNGARWVPNPNFPTGVG